MVMLYAKNGTKTSLNDTAANHKTMPSDLRCDEVCVVWKLARRPGRVVWACCMVGERVVQKPFFLHLHRCCTRSLLYVEPWPLPWGLKASCPLFRTLFNRNALAPLAGRKAWARVCVLILGEFFCRFLSMKFTLPLSDVVIHPHTHSEKATFKQKPFCSNWFYMRSKHCTRMSKGEKVQPNGMWNFSQSVSALCWTGPEMRARDTGRASERESECEWVWIKLFPPAATRWHHWSPSRSRWKFWEMWEMMGRWKRKGGGKATVWRWLERWSQFSFPSFSLSVEYVCVLAWGRGKAFWKAHFFIHLVSELMHRNIN